MKVTLYKLLYRFGIDVYDLKVKVKGFAIAFDECELVHKAFLASKPNYQGMMLDVGLAWGRASLPFLCDGWTVHGFEPDVSRSKNARLSAMSGFDRFEYHRYAVSDKSGEKLDFFQSPDSEGISSLHEFSNHEVSHQVETITLSDFTNKNGIESVDFLKIDTEGHELSVLNGLDQDAKFPTVIVAEFDQQKSAHIGLEYSVLGDWLKEHGYIVFMSEWYPIDKYGTGHKFRKISRYGRELHSPDAWGNFIAVAPEFESQFTSAVLQHIPEALRDI